MNKKVASLSLTITALLASSLLQTTAARANGVKPAELTKGCSSEAISNPITDKLDTAEPVSDKIGGYQSVANPLDGVELEQSKALISSNPKLMQKPGKVQDQPCS